MRNTYQFLLFFLQEARSCAVKEKDGIEKGMAIFVSVVLKYHCCLGFHVFPCQVVMYLNNLTGYTQERSSGALLQGGRLLQTYTLLCALQRDRIGSFESLQV
jgi:hypothetical protein